MQETSLLRVGKWQDNPLDAEGEIRVVLEPLKQENGYLFGLLWSKQTDEEVREIGSLLAEEIGRGAQEDTSEHIQLRFEQVVTHINERLKERDASSPWNLSPRQVHACLGLVEEERFFLTGTGDIRALFLRSQEDGRYQVYNLLRGLTTEQPKPSWEKLFPALLDGDVRVGDAFCLFPDDTGYPSFSQDDIHTIISTLPPQGMCARLRQGFPDDTAYGFFAFRCDGMSSQPPELDSHQSISLLEQREASTAKWMAEASHTVSQYTEALLNRARGVLETVLNSTRHFFTPASLKRLTHQTSKGAGTLSSRFKTGSRGLRATISHLFQKIPPRARLRVLAVAGGTLVLGVVIVLLLVWSRHRGADQTIRDQFALSDRLQARAETALTQNNTGQAQNLFEQALRTLGEVKPRTDTQRTMQENKRMALEELQKRLQKAETPTITSVIEDIAGSTQGQQGDALVKQGGQILLITRDGQSWAVDTTAGTLTSTGMPATLLSPLRVSSSGETLYTLDARPGISTASTGVFTQTSTVFEGIPPTALTTYADRLYIVFGNEEGLKRILRADITGSTLGSLTPWLTGNTPTMSKPVDVVVDGMLYLLSTTGQVSKFSRGQALEWQLETVSPPLASGHALATEASSRFLTVLDGEVGRVLIFEKETGRLVVQYVEASLQGAVGMLVQEDARRILIVTETRILEFPLTHL